MMNHNTDLKHLLDFATLVAREAGEVTLRYFRQPLTPERKADNSFVTIADRHTEALIRRAILREFPDDAILGEEEGERPGTSGFRWIIDPIDGTFSFVHGVPFYGVMIGIEIDGEPVVGVVNMPAVGELVAAAKGFGCFLNGGRARVSEIDTLEQALLLTTDLEMCEQHGFGPATSRLRARSDKTRTWGDCYGHLLVATGRAEVMLDPIMNPWDCAALLPIIEEAGGTFTDWNGNRTIHGGNAISTNGVLFGEAMKEVRG